MVQPNLTEGYCNAVLEAQAHGLLCITTDAGGLKENVIDGKSGWIVKRADPESFAHKIKEVNGKDSETLDRFRHDATHMAKQENTDTQIESWIEFYSH